MYVTKANLEAVSEAIGIIDHESGCRGDQEFNDLAKQLEKVLIKMGKDIRKRKRKAYYLQHAYIVNTL